MSSSSNTTKSPAAIAPVFTTVMIPPDTLTELIVTVVSSSGPLMSWFANESSVETAAALLMSIPAVLGGVILIDPPDSIALDAWNSTM